MTDKIEVMLVTGWGCRPCEKVKQRLTWLAGEFPEMHVSEVDIGTEEGTRLAIRYKLASLPGILINGHMALIGEVSPEHLRERLLLVRQTITAKA